MTLNKSRTRLDFLDALRGVAALMVAYLHYSRYFLQQGLVTEGVEYQLFSFFNNYVDLGKVGVVVFFAISGIVIPFSLLRTDGHPIRRFMISRFARLYPVYWCSIPAGIFAYWYLQDSVISLSSIVLNFTMLQQFFLVENVMGLYWTLQVELIFYGLCVLVFYFGWLERPKMLFAISLLFIVLAVLASWVRYSLQIKIPVALFLALAFMFWGAIWRSYIIEGDLLCRRYALIIFSIIFLLMPVVSLLAYNQDMGFSETWYRYTLSYYTAMAVLIVFTVWVRIDGAFFSWLGRISYSVYLFHGVVFVVFMHYIGSHLFSLFSFSAHLYVVFSMCLTLGVSSVTYLYIEKPMIDLGRIVFSKITLNTSNETDVVSLK